MYFPSTTNHWFAWQPLNDKANKNIWHVSQNHMSKDHSGTHIPTKDPNQPYHDMLSAAIASFCNSKRCSAHAAHSQAMFALARTARGGRGFAALALPTGVPLKRTSENIRQAMGHVPVPELKVLGEHPLPGRNDDSRRLSKWLRIEI